VAPHIFLKILLGHPADELPGQPQLPRGQGAEPLGHITALSLTPPRLLTSGYLEVKCEENRFTSPADPRNPFSISVLDPQAKEEAALFCRYVEELRRRGL